MNPSLDLTHANGLALLSPAINAVGWTLVHFVWQGTAIGVAVACLLAAMRSSSPRSRYTAGCVALSLMFLSAAATLGWQIAVRDVGAKRGQRPAQIVAFSPPVATKTAAVDTRAGRQAVPVESFSIPREALPLSRSLPATAAPFEPTAITVEESRDFAWAGKSLGEPLRAVLPWLVGVWACGVGFCSLRLWAGWRVIRRLRAQGQEPNDSEWNARFDRLRRRIGCSTSVRLLWSASATVPMVIGWVRPVVLVPAGLLTGLSAAQLEAILAHELAHIRRHDFLVNLLQNVLETLFFYHPAVWWVSQQVRNEREHCCDDLAAGICGGPLNYARALTALAEVRHASGRLGLAATGGSLVARIARLAGLRSPAPRVGWPLTALVLLGGAFAAFLAAQRSGLSDDSRVQRVSDSNGALNDRIIARSNASKLSKLNGTEVVANVNGEPILASDVFNEEGYCIPLEPGQMSLMAATQELKAGQLWEDEYRQLQEIAIHRYLDDLIKTRLMAQAFFKNLDKQQTRQVETAISKMFKEYVGRLEQDFHVSTREQVAAKLQRQGQSLDRLRQEFRRRLLADEYLRKQQQSSPITRATLEAYYRNHLNEYRSPEKVRWQLLEIGFERHAGRQGALEVAQKAGAELRRGESFASVVRKYSDRLRRRQAEESCWTMLDTPDDQEQGTAIRQIAAGDIKPVFDEQWEGNTFAERIVSSNALDKKTQATETSAGALVVQRVQLDCTSAPMRRIHIRSRGGNEFNIFSRAVPNRTPAEQATILTGGVTVLIGSLHNQIGCKPVEAVELSADRMVIWSRGDLKDKANREGGIVQPENEPFDVYLEGNVVIFQQNSNNPKLMREAHARSATFNPRTRVVHLLNCESGPGLPSMPATGVWAERMRQLGPNPFSSKDVSTIPSLCGKDGNRVQGSDAVSAPGFSLEKIGADVVIQVPARGAENLRPPEAADRDARTSFDADGGTQSWTNPASVANPRLSAVLQQLAPGETSAVLESADAFHIVRVVDRRPAACKPFDEVEPSIRRKLEQQLQEKIIEGLYHKATIESAYLPASVPKRGARERG